VSCGVTVVGGAGVALGKGEGKGVTPGDKGVDVLTWLKGVGVANGVEVAVEVDVAVGSRPIGPGGGAGGEPGSSVGVGVAPGVGLRMRRVEAIVLVSAGVSVRVEAGVGVGPSSGQWPGPTMPRLKSARACASCTPCSRSPSGTCRSRR
jgi:hypothetical protein